MKQPPDTTASARRPAIERFIDAAQRATDEPHAARQAVEELRRAQQIAGGVLLSSDVLDSTNDAIETYIRTRQAEAAAARSADNPVDDASAVERDAVYFVALALGLMLSEVL